MSTSTFGEITSEAPQDGAGTQTAPTAEVVDINDPRLTSENVEQNPAGDAFAAPPVLPDGVWRAKLSQFDIKDANGNQVRHRTALAHWKQPPVPYFCINVQADVIDHTGKYDGLRVQQYWIRTLLEDRGNAAGTSQMATVARKAGANVPAGTKQSELLAITEKVLAGEPEVGIETFWEASCAACAETADKKGDKKPKPFLKGMHRFPQPSPGEYSAEVSCPVCHASVRAQVRILRYFTLAEMQGLQKKRA